MDDQFKVHNNPMPDDHKFADRLKNLMVSKDGEIVQIGDKEYERQKNGELRRMTPKKNEPVLNWRDRAIKAEKGFLNMIEERKKLQDLLLEACIKLEKYDFTCDAGSLKTCLEFQEIKSFARGVPHIVRPPLDTMLLNGDRTVMSLKGRPDGHAMDVFLECGHILELPSEDAPKINTLTSCGLCINLLEERGMFTEESECKSS